MQFKESYLLSVIKAGISYKNQTRKHIRQMMIQINPVLIPESSSIIALIIRIPMNIATVIIVINFGKASLPFIDTPFILLNAFISLVTFISTISIRFQFI